MISFWLLIALKICVNGKEDIAVYQGLLQEKIGLENEMVNLGIGSYDAETGEFLSGTAPSLKIRTLILPDVEVSGGSINVSTDDFTGKGKLNASGIPQIDIQNNSSAYLVTQKLTIADKGGAINYNDKSVKNNSDIGSGAAFAESKVADATKVPTITVSNNYSGQSSIPVKPNPKAKGYKDLPEKAKTETQQYEPINYIEITGNVSNSVGKVQISNKQGSIRINKGKTVEAMDIEMTAKDSISQDYTEGIVNIAYTPEDAYPKDAAINISGRQQHNG